MQKFLKQEYGEKEKINNALNIFIQEGKDIAQTMGIEDLTDDNVLLELYAEYRIYSAMGNEKIASFKLSSFNNLIKGILELEKRRSSEKKQAKKKGMLIFNE